MHKLNRLTATLASIAAALILVSSSMAANYQRKNAAQPAPTGAYKGEVSSRVSKTTNYKGEIQAKPVTAVKVYKPVTRPVMAPITLKEGPYFGAAAGYDSYKIHEFSQFTGTTNASYGPTINATGLIGAVMGGYGHYFNNALYLGLEVFLDISEAYQSSNYSINNATDDISYNSKFFVSTGYGASLLPGVKLSDSALVFMRLGYQVARLRGQENLQDNVSGSTFISNTSSWSGGISYGLGFEEAMVENFSLRGEFIHTDFRSFSATSGTEYSPSNNQFLLALIYHIA